MTGGQRNADAYKNRYVMNNRLTSKRNASRKGPPPVDECISGLWGPWAEKPRRRGQTSVEACRRFCAVP